MDSTQAVVAAVERAYRINVSGCQLLNFSENWTYRLDLSRGLIRVLRIYRPRWRTPPQIRAELAWILALRNQIGISTPSPIPTPSGDLVCGLPDGRYAALFEHVCGQEPASAETGDIYESLGEICARIHDHGAAWSPPPGTHRPMLSLENLVGHRGIWGNWRHCDLLNHDDLALLERLCAAMSQLLEQYGRGGGRHGLIHGDLRLANLLLADGNLHVIDFDDCAFCWHLYDLASAVTFIEDDPQTPRAIEAWLRGYCGVRPLNEQDRSMVPVMILLRRIQIISWFVSHSDTDLARSLAATTVAATLAAARQSRLVS